ncbi:hypothetical protein K788_0003529 [Paraburkholderia caribensis MBA4]|uniref:Uncharacterized protein n=1 Tax=Paraburkholderia caribensis MBA4 TaxID=1323664 RepID=A0A0N7JTF6_9BURK|nr:hypothetical protein K788_0003529 [Paraburkholderia caribensis MBA4]
MVDASKHGDLQLESSARRLRARRGLLIIGLPVCIRSNS